MSWIQNLTSKTTQVCKDICDIILRWLLVTCLKQPDNVITKQIQTNQSDHKDTSGSDRNKPGSLDKHRDCAEGDNNYTHSTPNHCKPNNPDTLRDHDTDHHLLLTKPSGMLPLPHPDPYPSETFEGLHCFQLHLWHHQRRIMSGVQPTTYWH